LSGLKLAIFAGSATSISTDCRSVPPFSALTTVSVNVVLVASGGVTMTAPLVTSPMPLSSDPVPSNTAVSAVAVPRVTVGLAAVKALMAPGTSL